MLRPSFVTVIAVALSLMGASRTRASLITNGDFETGDLTGWSFSGNVGVGSVTGFHVNAAGVGTFPTGQYAADFGGADLPDTGILSQNIVTVAGVQYTLTFDYGKFETGSATQAIAVSATNRGDNDSLLLQTISDSSGTADLSTVFSPYSFSFVATGLQTDIQFSDVSAGTMETDGLLDNVAVIAVPEPSSLVLLGASGLFMLRRQRRKLALVSIQ